MARKILLADDSVTAQNMGRKILADAGYEVITVNNGSAALKKIAEQKPDLIVLDVYMPGYSGLEVCQRLKEVPETSRIPVLLTVGKLEPFKPEEAKRVRAEGFIVKPFEASELLSSLSKLEDKIVPRSEPSKPGRFARAIAAVEQSNRDRNEAANEDSGWKNRISFPSKKKKKEETADSDDPAIYNALNRDLRTVVLREETHREQGASAKGDAGKMPESTVDLAAVTPADLPKDSLPRDVTPEEIAAIAAAAAQVQGAAAAARETRETPVEANSSASESASLEQKSEEIETKSESRADEYRPATFAEHSSEEKLETPEAIAETKEEDQQKATTIPGEREVGAAIATLESGSGQSWKMSSPGNGAAPPVDLPVTMPVAAAAVGSSTGPRWTAVPVAIDAAESAISLEQEMQAAQAALVVRETVHTAPAVVADAAPDSSESLAVPVAEPAHAATYEENELAHALSAVANVRAEAVAPALAGPAVMAESHADSMASTSAGELASPVPAAEGSESEVRTQEIVEETHAPGRRVVEQEAGTQGSPESTEAKTEEEASGTDTHETESAEPVAAAPEEPVKKESAAGGIPEMAEKRESELAASTAAAWASWRQIRNSDEPKAQEDEKGRQRGDEADEAPNATEPAAMAVAAGAEKSPEEGTAGADPRAIARIVDSVLAELRPKIVEEISRKLGEKK